jgi:hypothetical protein
MGLFHKGSGGKGVAPGDVCLSPPPPPAGPAPVPYVNMLQATNLSKGSKSVKIQGEPTALENASFVSTSTGNEAGTQGGGVVTHKTKGKGSFKLWSFVVKIEGKGVCRHGDPMEQNTACPLPNTIDAAALVNFRVGLKSTEKKKCKSDYDYNSHYQETTTKQKQKVQNRACWECRRDLKNLKRRKNPPAGKIKKLQAKINRQKNGQSPETPMIADHQPTQKAAWYAGGCNLTPSPQAFKDAMKELYVKPHCSKHSNSQPGRQSKVDNQEVWDFMKGKGV